MARRRIPADQQTPITNEVKYPSTRTGRLEIWSADSVERAPGTGQPLWTYHRTEDPTTPWVVTHTPTGRWALYGTLDGARHATRTGAALEYLDALDHERNAETA